MGVYRVIVMKFDLCKVKVVKFPRMTSRQLWEILVKLVMRKLFLVDYELCLCIASLEFARSFRSLQGIGLKSMRTRTCICREFSFG